MKQQFLPIRARSQWWTQERKSTNGLNLFLDVGEYLQYSIGCQWFSFSFEKK
jgi:hypothetical protein